MNSNILLILLLSIFAATFTGAQTPKLDEPLAGEVVPAGNHVPKLAATLAATLANREAKKKFDSEPFSPTSADATLRGGRWEWQDSCSKRHYAFSPAAHQLAVIRQDFRIVGLFGS